MGIADPIAIVGMAGRFPAADGIDEYWANLLAGRDCITPIPDDELLRYNEEQAIIDTPGYVRRRPILHDSDSFDAKCFDMTPKEAELRDPQYRLMLETVHSTLEHAGYDPGSYPGAIGLFAGTNVNRYRYDYIERRRDIVKQVGYLSIDIANHPDYLSTFISYKLGLRGPSATMLTACSTSLVALHVACNSIRAGDCDMAIAGGVDIEFPYHRGYVYMDGGISARDGLPRAFDANATGTNFGDGVGAVLVKPLRAAIADRDSVYAVILGSAINNDGNRKVGFTAPSITGQSECIVAALKAAQVDPASISYVEAHGTGTRVGDPIELTGLMDAYRTAAGGDLPAGYCGIGSVKSNIGHLGQAAGAAALIKTTLALARQTIPPSIHVTDPNPQVDWETSPFYIVRESTAWPPTPGQPRRAAVSSFGIGGTNAHVVLEEAPTVTAASATRRDLEAILYSAVDATAVSALRQRLASHFRALPEDEFADAAHTLRVGRAPRAAREAVVASGCADAADRLADPAQVLRSDGTARRLVFAFPGQGAQRPGMYRYLAETEPQFRRGCDAAFDVLRDVLDVDLGKLWRTAADPAELAETHIAQPLLFVLESTLAHCLMYWGAEPDLLVGHSVGELVAAAVSGVLDFESGLRAVAARARAMQGMERGRMLSVNAGADGVEDLLGDRVALAAVNGPQQVVLSGPASDIDQAAEILASRGLYSKALRTSHAYHSPMMAEAATRFAAELGSCTLKPPRIPIISARTGTVMTDEEAVSPEFWAGQLTAPVFFDTAAASALADGPATVVEVGPGRALATLVRSRPGFRNERHQVLTTHAGGSDGPDQSLATVLARLWVGGTPVTYWHVDAAERGYRRVAVPGYPYQRQRQWVDLLPGKRKLSVKQPEPARPDAEAPADVSASAGPAASPDTAVSGRSPARPSWRLGKQEWVPAPASTSGRGTATGTAVVVLPASAAGTSCAIAFQLAGYRVVRVTDDPEGGFDGTDQGQWAALLDRVLAAGAAPAVVAYCRLLDAPSRLDDAAVDAQLDAGLYSVYAGLKATAALRRQVGAPIRFVLIGRNTVDVSGSEAINPAAAMIHGLLRSAAQEIPGVPVHAVDVGDRTAEHMLASELAQLDEDVVALRGTTRWRPAVRPAEVSGRAAQALRQRGTYLITGGLGGLGLITAQAMADTGLRPRLGLLGRSGAPAADSPAGATVQAALADMTLAGADVMVLSADVADPSGLDAAVTELEQRFGTVNGVVHAAGVPGGGLLERRGTDQVRQVLAAKVQGVLALEDVFRGRPELDFLFLYSSQAALTGLFGSSDYAAANAFLDAYARTASGGQRQTVSIQWPGWSAVGMAAQSSVPLAMLSAGVSGPAQGPDGATATDAAATGETVALTREFVPGQSWEFTEHVFEGTQVLPGTALLDLVLTAALAAGLRPAGSAVELQDTVFLSPVVGDRPRTVRVLLKQMAQAHRFRVQSMDGDGWAEHANGIIVAVPQPAEGERPARPGPAESQPAATDDAGPAAAGRDAATGKAAGPQTTDLATWLTFGPRWQIAGPGTGTATERVIPLELPATFAPDLDQHPLHPAILDVATGVLTDVSPGKSYAPFMYRRLLFAAPLAARVTVHARFRQDTTRSPRPTDFEIYDAGTGQLLVAVEAFTMREAPATFGRKEAAPRPPARAAAPSAPAPSATRPSAPAQPGLLSPGDGAEVLRHLLTTGLPPVILVQAPGQEPSLVTDEARPLPPAQPGRPPVPALAGPPSPVSAASRLAPAVPAPVVPDGSDVTGPLRELWTDALGIADIGPDDDFFEIGGTSLSAVTLTSRVNDRFGVQLSAGTLFDAGTIRTLAAAISRAAGSAG